MKKLFYLLVFVLSFTSCVKDTDYETPQIQGVNPTIPSTQLSSIQNVIAQWAAANPTGTSANVVQFVTDAQDPVYISGYVVSDDKTGNFYKELYIQDSPSDPQYAVKIAIDMTSLYTKYDMGRKIYVKLNGLAINKKQGEMVIGEYINGTLANIRENKAKLNISRDIAPVAITPKSLTIGAINTSHIGMYVKFDNLQFDQDLLGKPFVNPLDSYDTFRSMVSCDSGELALETSTYASFKAQILPSGKGSVVGVLSRNYNDGFYVLKVVSPEVFTFTGQRCDPLFQDGFGNGFAKWTTFNVLGAQVWTIDTQYGNPGNCAKMSGYAGTSNANEDWLITKPINLSGVTNAKLNFQTARNFTGNSIIVYVSTNYNGTSNPNTAGITWTVLPATIATANNFVWTNSGDVSLTPYCGQANVYIAFRYTSTTSASATWEVDNVKVTQL